VPTSLQFEMPDSEEKNCQRAPTESNGAEKRPNCWRTAFMVAVFLAANFPTGSCSQQIAPNPSLDAFRLTGNGAFEFQFQYFCGLF
jgi:hypothetical protein